MDLTPGSRFGAYHITTQIGRPDPGTIDLGIFRCVAHEDPNWDWRTFDLERDTALALQKGGYVEVTDPDLSAFKSRAIKQQRRATYGFRAGPVMCFTS